MPKWIDKWEGGRIAENRHGKQIYYIESERWHKGKRIERISKALGEVTIKQARAQLALFQQDPQAYATPVEHREAKYEEDERRKVEDDLAAVYLTDKLIDDFIAVKTSPNGYSGSKRKARAVCDEHAWSLKAYLKKWQEKGPLRDRDLRSVDPDEVRAFVETLGTPGRQWIVALKSLTAWLCYKPGTPKLTKEEDPARKLTVPQYQEKTQEERVQQVYDVRELEATYRHIPSQTVRDVFRIRLATGLHVSEIERISKGDCTVTPVKNGGAIAATVDVKHKSGQEHRMSVDKPTLAALRRLQAANSTGYKRFDDNDRSYRGFPTTKTLLRNMKEAHLASGIRRVVIAHLRHTQASLALEYGKLVRPTKKRGGVAPSIVADRLGHSDTSMVQRVYSGVKVPPMIVLPLKLIHPSDPD